MTRTEMARIIREDRGSVTYQGRIIKSVEDLPTEAELAAGNVQEEKRVQADILGEIAKLKAELDKLQTVSVEDKPKTRKAQGEAPVLGTT